METKRIKKTKGECLATGYKIFTSDWGDRFNTHIYGTDEDIVGSIHEFEDEIDYKWGLEFYSNPLACFALDEPCQWNKFAKVEAYDQVIKNGSKRITNILKIVEIYTFDEFIKLTEKLGKGFDSGISGSYGILCGYGIRATSGVFGGSGISIGYGIRKSEGIYRSKGISSSKGISESFGISYGDGICYGTGISGGDGISFGSVILSSSGISSSEEIRDCEGISRSDGISDSEGISRSKGISRSEGISSSEGISESFGISSSWGLTNCKGCSLCILCYEYTGKFAIFNKKVSKNRFDEVKHKIKSIDWYPQFTNIYDLKCDKKVTQIDPTKLKNISLKEAWSTIPEQLDKYIRSLEEFDAEIYNKIRGIDNESEEII